MNWLTVKEAAAAAGVSESLIYLWTGTEKRLRHRRVGRKDSRGSIRIRLADLEAFMDLQTVEPETPKPKKPAAGGGTFRHIDPSKAGKNRLSSSSSAAC